MPPIDKRPAKKPAARRGAVGRGADTIPQVAGPPAPTPKPRPTGVFKPGATTRPATAKLTVDAPKAAQRKVDTARRALPPATVAAPPVVTQSGTKASGTSGKPISPAQVKSFLKLQTKATKAARTQIVSSIRQNVGNVHGAQRVEAIDRLIREIATDPRHAGTRKAIQHYTALEQAHSRPQVSVAKPGPAPRKAKLGVGPVAASINLTAASQAITNAAEKVAPGLTSGSPEAQFARNALKDVGTLGKAPFVGGYALGKALTLDVASQLAGGGEKEFGKHSTEFAKAILSGTAEEIKHPVKALKEHPVLTVLDAAGGVSAAGRGAGAVARGVGKKGARGVRGKFDEHSHTVRPPIALVDDSGQPVLVQRTYSKDLTRRAAQATRDRGREPVRDPDGNVVTVEDRGRKVPVLKATEAERDRHFKKRGDMVASRANSGERKVREETVRDSKVRGVKGKAAKDIVAMAVEGTLTGPAHFADDLRKVRDDTAARIARHENGTEPFRHSGDLEAARGNLAQAERILRDPKAMRQGPAIIAEAMRHGGRLREGDAASVAGQIGDEKALNRAALSTTALQHLGARHFTVEEHAALERDARKAEVAAVEKYQQAKTPAERHAALAELDDAREARIAVSGREPVAARAHETARAGHGVATGRHKRAVEAETKAEARVRDLTVRHKSERGREGYNQPLAAYYVGDKRFELLKDAQAYKRSLEATLTPAQQKSIARNRRKGQPRPEPRVRVSADDAFSTRPLPVERTGGTPHLPADQAEWFHGTPAKFEGVPSAQGQWSDLGVYLTTDPKYARGYADAPLAAAAGHDSGIRGHIIPIRVSPKRVLDMRAGHHNPADMIAVIRSFEEGVERGIKAKLDADVYARDPRYRERREHTLRNNWLKPLEDWKARLASSNGKLDAEQSKGLQETLEHLSETVGSALGLKGTGNRHQFLATAIRAAGFDAIRKVDLHADALVVLDESIMRRVTGGEGTPGVRGAASKVEIRRVALTPGEAKRVGELSQARRALAAAKAERRAAAKGVRTAEHHVKANPLPEANAALRYGEDSAHLGKKPGEFLSNKDIEDFLTSRGRDPQTVAHLTHRQNDRGSRAHHAQLRPGNRPRLDGGDTRTGSAYLDRVTESSQALIRDEGVRQATQLNKAKALDSVVSENGLRHPAWAKAQAGKPLTKGEQRVVDEGGLFTPKEALETATRLEKDTGQRFTPMTAYQARLSEDTQRIIRENLQGPNGMETLPQRLLNDRIVQPSVKPDKQARNVVLVPSELVERLEAHLRPAGQVEKFFQYLNKPFRYAVLPQPRWLTGNFAESYIVRLPTVGSGINIPGLLMDLHAERQAMNALRNGTPEMQEAARLIEAQQTGSGLFVGGKAGTVRRTPEEAMPQFAQRAYGKIVAKLPATQQMAELTASAIHWIAMPLHAFFWINQKLIESPAQKAAFGHTFRRDLQAITGSWIKAAVSATDAVADAAKGLVNTPAQERFMHDQYALLGKYAGQSPMLRAFTQSVAPFLPWMLNAARFVYWTMPAHNTVKTALLVKAYEVQQQDWDDIHRSVPPGGLKDAIPTPGGGWLDLARYTPYGLTAPIASGGNLASIPAQFTPQFGGAANALAGRDPFGRPLKVQPTSSNPRGKPSNADLVKIAAYSLFEAAAPYMSTGRRLQEHGETSFANSTIFGPKTKPGTSHGQSAVERTFSPFRATYLGGPSPSPAAARFQKAREQIAPQPVSPEDALLDNLYNSLDSANGQQELEDKLLDNLYGGG